MFVNLAPHGVQVSSPRAAGQVGARGAGPPEEVGEGRGKLLPRRLLERLRSVPGQKLRVRQTVLPLRRDQAGAVVGEQFRFRVVTAL